MQTAGVGALVVHIAAPSFGVQVLAIAIGAARQGEDAVLEIKVLDHAHFLQALGNLFGLFVFGLKRVNQFKANQVGQLHFHWHGAAVGGAGVAQAVAIAGPCVAVVDVDDADV